MQFTTELLLGEQRHDGHGCPGSFPSDGGSQSRNETANDSSGSPIVRRRLAERSTKSLRVKRVT